MDASETYHERVYQEWIRAEQGLQQEPAAYQRSVCKSRESFYTGAIHGKVHADHFVNRLYDAVAFLEKKQSVFPRSSSL